ncbi:PREDICTED: putative uncharacterized protein UNQ6975/PRO21958 [Cercocebus atys]|uniref:putative uncharacterized protein UNQ6975/PRO21958 n=1 Tax=Cercocebus atys TaxID=9531 RepID=UPI0005F4EC32|nr:PREDICTED: putative uncharacterized protein UNQ6975/PRO21958 [Cercocebus atys]
METWMGGLWSWLAPLLPTAQEGGPVSPAQACTGYRHKKDKDEISPVMERQAKCYLTSEEEEVCCARRNRRKLHERGEPYKPNRISKGEDNVPRQATSETQRNKSKNCIWGMMSGPKLME